MLKLTFSNEEPESREERKTNARIVVVCLVIALVGIALGFS